MKTKLRIFRKPEFNYLSTVNVNKEIHFQRKKSYIWSCKIDEDLNYLYDEFVKVHIFWEGYTILQNLHLTFDYSTHSQIQGRDFEKFCCLLRIYELYKKETHVSATIWRKICSACKRVITIASYLVLLTLLNFCCRYFCGFCKLQKLLCTGPVERLKNWLEYSYIVGIICPLLIGIGLK